MLIFDNWKLKTTASADVIGRQYDHLSRRLDVTGDLPEGWDWAMLVRCGDDEDTILMEPAGEGVGAVLSEKNLARGGYYTLQLRGTLRADGVTRRHTNPVRVFIPKSLAGTGTWPEAPTEFTQMERRIQEAAARVQAASVNPPVLSAADTWMIYDQAAGAYKDTGILARGRDGADGRDGVNGRDGADGAPGADGQSAYDAAQSAGFTGGKAEFDGALSALPAHMSGHGAYAKTAAFIENWNTANCNGIFMGNNAANAPAADGWYIGETYMHNDQYCVQRVYSFAGSHKWFERFCNGGNWSPWRGGVSGMQVSPTDLTAGVSALGDGELYLVYE